MNGAQRGCILRAILVVGVIRVGLVLLPFRIVQQGVDRLRRPAGPGKELDRQTIRLITWSVEAASRCIHGATCLPQAMAAQVLLGRLGQRSELRLGVARNHAGRFEAHAWVEAQDRVVIGGTVTAYKRLAS